MKTNRDYFDAMNAFDLELNDSDKEYFRKLREYMRTSSLFINEKSINIQIYQMYLDFFDAKEDGISAEEYFGNQPKEMADELLKHLPKTPFKNILQYTFIVSSVFWGIRLLYDSLEVDTVILTINPLVYLFDTVISFILIIGFFHLIQTSVYRKKEHPVDGRFRDVMGIFILSLFVILSFASPTFLPVKYTFAVPYPYDVLLILGITLLYFIFIWKLKIDFFYTQVPFLILLIVMAILERLQEQFRFTIPFRYRQYIFFIIIVFRIGIHFYQKYRKSETEQS